MPIQDTDSQKIKSIFEKQQAFATEISNTTSRDRVQKLEKIESYLLDQSNQQRLKDALSADLRKPEVEAMTSEIGVLLKSIKDIKSNLRGWMSDKSVSTPLVFFGSSSYVHYEPKGVALIISPWNYPFQLCINPLLYAIAAGCTAMLKPSEYSEHTSTYIAKMITELFEEKEVAVCQGAIPTSEALLKLPFDHMYFTGSPTVGRIVMKAASEHLSSVTLELGGKSPCIVDESVNIDKAAKSLVWGKFFNAGQTCIAPDYVLVNSKIHDQFVAAIAKQITKMFNPEGKGIQQSPDLARLISSKHFEKVESLLSDAVEKGADVVTGGFSDAEDRYIEPTVLTKVPDGVDLLHEEIFGPIMPVLKYDKLEEALEYIRRKPKPLAFYILSKNSKNINHIIKQSTAGGTVINDFLIHFANHNLPFGGVNYSGIGKSHGRHGFLAFSNERSVMRSRIGFSSLLYPPYSGLSRKVANLMGRWI